MTSSIPKLKRTPLRKKSKNPAEQLRKKAVVLAKWLARNLANNICEHCGKSKKDKWQMHGSHIYPEGVYRAMSADVDNILCLCATCHTGGFWKNSQVPSWHEDPIYFSDWFRKNYPARYKALKLRTKQSIQADTFYWTKKLEELTNLKGQINKSNVA